MRILQCNLGRSVGAHEVAYAIAMEQQVNLIVASEPNKRLVTERNYIVDKRTDVAVIPMNRAIGITQNLVKVSLRYHLINGIWSPAIYHQIYL